MTTVEKQIVDNIQSCIDIIKLKQDEIEYLVQQLSLMADTEPKKVDPFKRELFL